MISAKDMLSKSEHEEYQQSWLAFPQRFEVATPKEVHNGRPVISKTYRHNDTNIFRAHVISRRLREFDPYFRADKYQQPFWHAIHYFIVAEQLYTAAAKQAIGIEYERQVAKDVPTQFNWRRPVFWNDNISVELIREDLEERAGYSHTRAHLTILSDKTGKVLSQMSADAYSQPRSYIRDIARIQSGDEEGLEALVRKIQTQSIHQRKLLRPRTTLATSAEELIEKIRKKEIPMEGLHDFFSLWE
ncbi:MAG: hypothetical protein ACTSU7_09885 [Candidatus Heimdallarchaeaceae archaeon]